MKTKSGFDAGGLKTEGIGMGQKVVTPYGRDNSSFGVPNTRGAKMGGSTTNLAHSLSGASANQKGQ